MTDLRSMLLENVPLIDVRSPSEFKAGHFPSAVNLPILDDDERHRIGIEYKMRGADSAIRLGHELVSGSKKEDRVSAWKNYILKNPGAAFYCFRGGLRSKISCDWTKKAGVEAPVVQGGYKRLRGYLRENLEREIDRRKLLILGGKTGAGKTRLLENSHLEIPFIDLEKIAQHRGSAFGARGALGYQPTQATFEIALGIAVLRLESGNTLLLEDESRSIGAVEIPTHLYSRMREAPLVILESPIEARIAAIFQEYVVEKTTFFEGNAALTETFLSNALSRISKKLGGLKTEEIQSLLKEAFSSENGMSVDRHSAWIAELLRAYYDPLYEYHLKKDEGRIVFRGNNAECVEFLRDFSRTHQIYDDPSRSPR